MSERILGEIGRSMHRILIDNSTYFSARGLLGSGELEPHSLYNAIKFVEALVTADTIHTAPSSRWSPSEADRLFSIGVCSPLAAQAIGKRALRYVFEQAIASARDDLNDPIVRALLNFGSSTKVRADRLLLEFAERAQDPFSFMDEYSASVFITDKNSSSYQIDHFATGIEQNAPAARHIAQYLLRTNTALELAALEGSDGIPYHPHSHRTGFVVHKLATAPGVARFAEDSLLKVLESEISVHNSKLYELAGGLVRASGSDVQTPIIVTILSGVRRPDEIISCALEIRDNSVTRRYRAFVADVTEALKSGDIKERRSAIEQMRDAKAVLIHELDKLYGQKHSSTETLVPELIGVAAKIAVSPGTYQPGINEQQVVMQLIEPAVKYLGKKLSSPITSARRLAVRWRIAFLLRLARQEGGRDALDAMLKRCFGRGLSSEQKRVFASLHCETPQVRGR